MVDPNAVFPIHASLANKIDWLFRYIVDKETHQPYTHEEILKRIALLQDQDKISKTLKGLSRANIANLRYGRNDAPNIYLVDALARAFGIETVLLLPHNVDSDPYHQAQSSAHIQVLNSRGILDLATRAGSLPPDSFSLIAHMVELAVQADTAERYKRELREASLDEQKFG